MIDQCGETGEGKLMTMKVRAVYEQGVLRPLEPITIPEGHTVDVTIAMSGPAQAIFRPPTPEEEEYARRLRAATSLEEMFAVMTMAPDLPDEFDLCQALDANRRAAGERLLFSGPDAEGLP
jgi:predicted DNA-binding antitoxin AbrB/MazE fold protein